MPKTVSLDDDVLVALKKQGLSLREIADRFNVSRETIKNRLKTRVSDRDVLEFANKLVALLPEVPNEYCARELRRTINFMRTHQAASPHAKFGKITDSLRTGARELEEIAEDCGLSEEETGRLLEQMCAQKIVERRTRGGVLNRGRKMKLHYYLAGETAQAA